MFLPYGSKLRNFDVAIANYLSCGFFNFINCIIPMTCLCTYIVYVAVIFWYRYLKKKELFLMVALLIQAVALIVLLILQYLSIFKDSEHHW